MKNEYTNNLEILKKEFRKYDFSLKLKDNDFIFWIDCCLIDGYGNKNNFQTDELYIEWEYNQYIFDLTNDIDLKAKSYQNDMDNIDNITDFIDNNNNELIKEFFENGGLI